MYTLLFYFCLHQLSWLSFSTLLHLFRLHLCSVANIFLPFSIEWLINRHFHGLSSMWPLVFISLWLLCVSQTCEPNRPEDFHLLAESEHGRHSVCCVGLRHVQSAAQTTVMPEPKYPRNHLVFTGVQIFNLTLTSPSFVPFSSKGFLFTPITTCFIYVQAKWSLYFII